VSQKPHSIAYIRQMIQWGFDLEFIAKDAGIELASLEMRLYRAEKRERNNVNQGKEPETGSDKPNS
jgi:hypothetical protein